METGLRVKPYSWHLAYGKGSLLHHSFTRSFIYSGIHEAPTACQEPCLAPRNQEQDKRSAQGGQTEAIDHLSVHRDGDKLSEDKFRALWPQI